MQGCRRKNKIAALAHATYENPVWVELDRGVIPENEIIDEMIKVAPQYEADIRRFFKEGKAFVVKAFDYAANWIKELKSRGYKVYLLSNYPKDFFELHTHSELSFVSLVDGKVISAMVGMIKPDAGIYQCLFDKYNLNPKECVFIDDRPENIEGGRKLGMEGIVFTDYETGKKKLEQMLSEK